MNHNYSVLMSVYYKEQPQFLREAMNSILEQTIPTNDFVLVCDGPLNEELDLVIEDMKLNFGSILNVVRLQNNQGLGNALKIGLEYCKNSLVARMDSDDICVPNRCELQLKNFTLDNRLAIISGTVEQFTTHKDMVLGKRIVPSDYADIITFSKRRNPFNHPAVMFKKEAVEKSGSYNNCYPLFEDYYLWVRMLQNGFRGKNLIETMVYMRTPVDMYKRRGGFLYAKNLLAFNNWMLRSKWITISDYLFSAIPHAIVCVLPNSLRKFIYGHLHR